MGYSTVHVVDGVMICRLTLGVGVGEFINTLVFTVVKLNGVMLEGTSYLSSDQQRWHQSSLGAKNAPQVGCHGLLSLCMIEAAIRAARSLTDFKVSVCSL